MIGLEFIYEKELIYLLKEYHLTGDDGTLLFLSINQILFFFSNLAHFFRLSKNSESKKLNPSLIFILSFVAIIAIGVLFLHFPKSTNGNISSIDILFTTVSATCVTGLSTINISEAFTTTGKLIILLLIQIGGLGLMTLTSFFSIFLAGKVSVSDNLLVKDLLSEETIGRAKEILKQVTLLTLMIETIGAVLLYHSFPEHMKFTQSERIYFSIFHSISAFCNAGFSLFPDGLSVGFQNNKYFLSSIMVLIVFGGLGFPVLSQIKTKFLKPNNKHFRFSVSTKLALTVSLYLWILGFISYYFLESKFTLSGMSIFDRVFQSMFYSITTRTAGFNTLDIAQMGIPMTFMSFFLMWVGASPVSTGGGIKTTTFALSFLNILNQIRGKQRMEINHRTIASSSISRASATIVLSLFVIFSAVFILLITESGTFLDLCFEVVSAFGTVGLTRGITPNLSLYGKITICVVMFVGRVGILTLLIALSKKSKQINYSYPEEYVVVG
jgi:potassium uptake TrkH family protein